MKASESSVTGIFKAKAKINKIPPNLTPQVQDTCEALPVHIGLLYIDCVLDSDHFYNLCTEALCFNTSSVERTEAVDVLILLRSQYRQGVGSASDMSNRYRSVS